MVWCVRSIFAWSVGQRLRMKQTSIPKASSQRCKRAGNGMGRGIIVKDHSVIEGDASRQTCSQESASKHELIGFQGGIRCLETGIQEFISTFFLKIQV